MTIEEAIKYIDKLANRIPLKFFTDEEAKKYDEFTEIVKDALETQNKEKWIKIETRPMTEEEYEHFEFDCPIEDAFVYECTLPEDGQEVLVQTKWGITLTTFYDDDGSYFESYEDNGDIIAWKPLPNEYEGE